MGWCEQTCNFWARPPSCRCIVEQQELNAISSSLHSPIPMEMMQLVSNHNSTNQALQIDTIINLHLNFYFESSMQVGSKLPPNMNPHLTTPDSPNHPKRTFPWPSPPWRLRTLTNSWMSSAFVTERQWRPWSEVYLYGSLRMPREERKCRISFEGMAQFATSKLRANNARILATTRLHARVCISNH